MKVFFLYWSRSTEANNKTELPIPVTRTQILQLKTQFLIPCCSKHQYSGIIITLSTNTQSLLFFSILFSQPTLPSQSSFDLTSSSWTYQSPGQGADGLERRAFWGTSVLGLECSGARASCSGLEFLHGLISLLLGQSLALFSPLLFYQDIWSLFSRDNEIKAQLFLNCTAFRQQASKYVTKSLLLSTISGSHL